MEQTQPIEETVKIDENNIHINYPIIELTKREKIFYALWRFFSNVFNIGYKLKRIKWFFNRGKNGWAVEDTWNFELYLADVISQGVRHLKEHNNGTPVPFSHEEWQEVLEKMAQGFEAAKEQEDIKIEETKTNDEYHNAWKEKWDQLEIKRLEGMNLFVKHFHALWD